MTPRFLIPNFDFGWICGRRKLRFQAPCQKQNEQEGVSRRRRGGLCNQNNSSADKTRVPAHPPNRRVESKAHMGNQRLARRKKLPSKRPIRAIQKSRKTWKRYHFKNSRLLWKDRQPQEGHLRHIAEVQKETCLFVFHRQQTLFSQN